MVVVAEAIGRARLGSEGCLEMVLQPCHSIAVRYEHEHFEVRLAGEVPVQPLQAAWRRVRGCRKLHHVVF